MKNNLFGKDLISTQEWSLADLKKVLNLAKKMKRRRFSPQYTKILKNKTFLMFFYNPSVRTRQSFETAATELGGHAQFLEPKSMRLKTKKTAGETVKDAAKVMSRYGHGLGIRILEDAIEKYGDGDELVREYAKWASIPVISMAHDKFHPCQGLADIMALQEHMGKLKGKKLLLMWGKGALVRSWCSVQENLLITTRFGMNVTLCYPKGYDLDREVTTQCSKNARKNGSIFKISHDLKQSFKDAHVVYSRNWMSPEGYKNGVLDKKAEIKKAAKYKDWICDQQKMKLTNNAYFIHPMPVDRGSEVTNQVCDCPRSIIYDIAENRLHVQKALMALTIG